MDLSKYVNEPAVPEKGGQQFSKEEYAAMKKQEREELWAEIDTKAQEVFKDDASLRGFLDFVARCTPQKTSNLLLLYSQNPEIRQVKTFEKWKDERRTLKKGAHGYKFIATQEYEKDGEMMQGYSICRVYDVSQIRMQQPEPQEPEPMEEIMKALFREPPVPIQIADNLPDTVQAQYVPAQRIVFVRNGMSEVATFHSVNRELACAALDHRDGKYKRADVSAQAFCAAYVVAQRYGVDTSGFHFDRVCELQQNGAKDPKELRSFLNDVRTATYELKRQMDRNLVPPTQEHPTEEFNVQEQRQGKSGKAKSQPER